MLLKISHNFFHYEAGNLCRLFFPYEQLRIVQGETEEQDVLTARATLAEGVFTAEIWDAARRVCKTEKVSGVHSREDEEYHITKMLFWAFEEFTDYKPSWGMLTGIHPVKFFERHVKAVGLEEAHRIFAEKYDVTQEKLSLCERILQQQAPALESLGKDDFSLYISIPFCPSRCAYCSFVSQSVEKSKKLIAPYFDLLLAELRDTAELVKTSRLRMKSAYIGGGTPTTLSAEQLKTLIEMVKELFCMEDCEEFTVEAGRPDTIDEEKLLALQGAGVTRISINPQTLSDEVLKIIGRKHTAADIVNTYSLARKLGFDNINMDLIAGLQGDTAQSFEKTLEGVLALEPENITVHTLSLKRSAEIFRSAEMEGYHGNKSEVGRMIDYSVERLTQEGYEPYYLYRQSRMAGNFENTGWAKKGKACRYNIYTMDESQTVIACGAGGVSKIKDPRSEQLERIFNFKYAYEYMDRFSEILSRKKEVTRLYEQFRQRIH